MHPGCALTSFVLPELCIGLIYASLVLRWRRLCFPGCVLTSFVRPWLCVAFLFRCLFCYLSWHISPFFRCLGMDVLICVLWLWLFLGIFIWKIIFLEQSLRGSISLSFPIVCLSIRPSFLYFCFPFIIKNRNADINANVKTDLLYIFTPSPTPRHDTGGNSSTDLKVRHTKFQLPSIKDT